MNGDLFGMEIPALPDGVTALECVVTIKALDEEGDVSLYERKSRGLNSWEALGMVTTLADTLRNRLAGAEDGT
jgi:hypothetical protein